MQVMGELGVELTGWRKEREGMFVYARYAWLFEWLVTYKHCNSKFTLTKLTKEIIWDA